MGVFAALVLATFGAFFLASQLKSRPALLDDIRLMRFFSPNGDGERDEQDISFTLDETGPADIDVVDADGARVRRVAEGVAIVPSRRVRVRWDGRDDDGARAPDGQYRMRVILRSEGRAVLAALTVSEGARIVARGAAVDFELADAGKAEPPRFRVLRTDVEPPQEVRTFTGEAGERTAYTWDGRTTTGETAPPGIYLIAVETRDAARNLGAGPALPLDGTPIEGRPGVTVRTLAVQPPVRPARAGALMSFRVDARERPYRWSLRRLGSGKILDKGRKSAGRTTLVLRAPRGRSGVYLLEVASAGADTSVPVAVQARAKAVPLVVLPMVTWLGRDPVDTTGDGVPDTLDRGAPVRFPRLFAYPGGLPTGLARDVAPLLVWLDRQEIRYDITTDLALTFTDEPLAADRRGVLFAGSPEWVSRPVARRLRSYVVDGGRVATFAPLALRASVAVGDSVLSRPSPATPVDAFGGRIADVRSLAPTAPPLSVLGEDASLGLLEGFSGQLGGAGAVEELLSPGRGAEVVTSVGEEGTELRPALSAIRQGDGLVLRVGLPGWVRRLAAGDQAVEQLTRNLVDILRGARPRARSAK